MKTRNYYTKSEAAAILGVETWVLDDLIDVDLGPRYISLGKKIRYPKNDIRRWGASNLAWIRY
jgi:hypothetical protein